mmetsp:Transcript_71519/g.152840  ORF Transcript_71519/g.152840 Transcript_71519/m.152840 type:complete len:339 (-) Transcript_71519:140-1156(-)
MPWATLRHSIKQLATEEPSDSLSEAEEHDDVRSLAIGKTRELQPHCKEGEGIPRHCTKDSLANDDHEGLDPQNLTHRGHVCGENRHRCLRLLPRPLHARLAHEEQDHHPHEAAEGGNEKEGEAPTNYAGYHEGCKLDGEVAAARRAHVSCELQGPEGDAPTRRRGRIGNKAVEQGLHNAKADSVDHTREEESRPGRGEAAAEEARRPDVATDAYELRPWEDVSEKSGREGEDGLTEASKQRKDAEAGCRHCKLRPELLVDSRQQGIIGHPSYIAQVQQDALHDAPALRPLVLPVLGERGGGGALLLLLFLLLLLLLLLQALHTNLRRCRYRHRSRLHQ